MMGGYTMRAAVLGIGVAMAALMAGSAMASQGAEPVGNDPVQKAMAGTGVANPQNAMSQTLNPASLTDVGDDLAIGLTLFSPLRGYTVTGPGFVAPGPTSGTVSSGDNMFLLPDAAYSRAINADTSWGAAFYGAGGDNTDYAGSIANGSCGGGTGVFCGGAAGVDLKQVFLTVGLAHKFGPVSVGVAPVFAAQQFSAGGLGVFAPFSLHPAALTDNGADYAYGVGARLGVIFHAAPNFRIGLDGTTPIKMSKFSKYAGLFANGGELDIPGDVSAGVSVDVSPAVTLSADYKHIFYSGVAAVSNSSQIPLPFGSNGGPGFGWADVDVFALGAEWRATKALTLRAGYAHNTNPIRSRDVTLNILAPGVVTDHFTAGFGYKVGDHSTVDFSAQFMPTSSTTGIEVSPAGANPGRNISLHMHQFELALGYSYRW
ncbi:MAG: outer membrane protein transport protein [Hyphomicrobiales bacterium]|nr:outer membrane protein transport protein [Hyphomicrobiales bacterium]MDE2018435.1 outer membrane protein transport protein [Hyphomicrobiales bacterium]